MALPHAAAVAREARIAQAHADREATTAEQGADALKAEARRESMIKQAGYQAEIDKASAQAQQAGPLADASARQHVVVEETKVPSWRPSARSSASRPPSASRPTPRL